MDTQDTDSVDVGPYSYVPTEWICILFLVLYSISTILHVGQAIKYRVWWMIPTAAFAGVMEVFGWSARLWSSLRPDLLTPYEMQLVGTVLAPTPLIAANFIMLGKIINYMGPQFSRLKPTAYTALFLVFDVICLIVQATGGALAAVALGQGDDPSAGGHIMLGGIAGQLFAIAVYVALAAEFFLRFQCNAPICNVYKIRDELLLSREIFIMVFGMGFCTLCILVRSVYRTIELANGWSGPIISTESYFNWLDGSMITLAIYTFNFIHPGVWLEVTNTSFHASQKDAYEYGTVVRTLTLSRASTYS